MRRLAAIIGVALGLSACGGSDEILVMGGSLEPNQKLRSDMGASADMALGRFFASGDCAGATTLDECHFVSAVQGSMVNALDRLFTNRLRRAPFLWVEADGFAQLSYEFVGRGINVVLSGWAWSCSRVS